MPDHQPEVTRLAAQLGEAVGGPATPDPETPLSDAEHRLGQVSRLGESFAMDQDETVRRCGRQVLAVLGDGRDLEAGGVALIRAERLRQIAVEGHTPEHDAQHTGCELAMAAACYAMTATGRYVEAVDRWPWKEQPVSFKPRSELDCLVKAGALLAAEIDRIIALKAQEGSNEKGPGDD